MPDKEKRRFTAIVRRDGEWWVASCHEMPEANGQGRTKEEAIASLEEAIKLLIKDGVYDALESRDSRACSPSHRRPQPPEQK